MKHTGIDLIKTTTTTTNKAVDSHSEKIITKQLCTYVHIVCGGGSTLGIEA